MTEQEAIKQWKELNIEQCNMEFSCGGDSMDGWSFTFINKDGKEVEDDGLKDFFDDEIFRRVEFYEASDGYYQGESGTVEITLNEEDEEDKPFFEYYKNAQSEYSETHVSTMEITLTPAMVAYINENISNINGSNDGIAINYKRDFILSPEQAELEAELETLIDTETHEYTPDNLDCDTDDWYTFSTNLDGDGEDEPASNGTPVIKGNKLLVRMRNQYTDYCDSD